MKLIAFKNMHWGIFGGLGHKWCFYHGRESRVWRRCISGFFLNCFWRRISGYDSGKFLGDFVENVHFALSCLSMCLLVTQVWWLKTTMAELGSTVCPKLHRYNVRGPQSEPRGHKFMITYSVEVPNHGVLVAVSLRNLLHGATSPQMMHQNMKSLKPLKPLKPRRKPMLIPL